MFDMLKNAFKSLKDKIAGNQEETKQQEQSDESEQKEMQEEQKRAEQTEEKQKEERKVAPKKEEAKEYDKQKEYDELKKEEEEPESVLQSQELSQKSHLELLQPQELSQDSKQELPEEKKTKDVSTFTKIKSLFSSRYFLSDSDLDKITEELELTFLQADVSVDVCDLLLKKLHEKIKKQGVEKNKPIDKSVADVFIDIVADLIPPKYSPSFFSEQLKLLSDKKPYIIMFVGTNGTGKTTTISKLAYFLKSKGMSVVLSASDTYRAASIEQLEGHANKIGGIQIIKGRYGQDPASVAFDAISYANSHAVDFVLIDTAGRQDTNESLMKELQKIRKIANPNLVVFCSEALAGQAAIVQAKTFEKIVGFDCFVLTKADVDEKGGTLLSIAIGINKPILFLGIGQEYKDIIFFDILFLRKMFN